MRPYLRIRNQSFEHPLMQAAADGDLAKLNEQPNAGADLNQTTEHGSIPLVAAVRSQHSERLAVIRWMLENGAAVNRGDSESNSALHHACYLGDPEAAKLLLDHGAKWELDNSDHLAPLAAASSSGNWSLAKLLIQHGAEVNPAHGIPPLHATAMLGRDDPLGAELLISNGAKVNFRGKLGRTALMGAAMKGNPMIAELLLKAGADINARDDFGNTALMEAARSGANPVLERFVFWHPDTGYRDKPGRTALLVAVSSRRADPETIRLLLAMGADPHVRNREGREAGDLASAAGRWRVAKALGYEPVVGRSSEAGALTATQALSRIESEDERVSVDITDFETKADSDWAKRQLKRHGKTQLQAATAGNPAADSALDEVPPAAPQEPATRPAADPDWPEPGETAGGGRPPDTRVIGGDLEPAPRFELVAEDLPVPEARRSRAMLPESAADVSAAEIAVRAEPETAAIAEPGAIAPDTVATAQAESGNAAEIEPLEAADAETLDTPKSNAGAAVKPDATDGPEADAPAAPEAIEEPEAAAASETTDEPEDATDQPDTIAAAEPAQQAPKPEGDATAPHLDEVIDLGPADAEALESRRSGVFETPAAVSKKRQLGYDALLQAATRDDIDQMKMVMLSQEELPEWWLAAGFFNAVARGGLLAPRWLLDNGLSANASSEGGQTLLSCIVQQSPTPVHTITLLLDHRARAIPDDNHLLWISGLADHEHESDAELGAELEEQLAAQLPRLITAGASAGARDALGRSPLHWAVRYRGVKYVSALLAAGSDVDARDEGGNSVLMAALDAPRSCQLGIVRALIKQGADPRLTDDEGVSPISRAMDAGDDTVLKLLMLGGPGKTEQAAPVSERDSLVSAAAKGNLGRIKRLLAKRPDVNERDGAGCTALLRAAGGGHAHILTPLIAAGAGLNVAADNDTTPLGAAVLGDHLDVVRLLIEHGVPVDQPQQFGITPLMLAAARWYPSMTRALLKLGALVDQRDDARGTALMAAAQNAIYSNHLRRGEDTLKILLGAGAAVNAVNDEGQSALMLLLGVRARDVQSADGASLVSLVRLLIEAGADLDARDFTGWCALHAAAAHGFLEPTRELLAAGASKRVRDINGLSPCDLAMDHAHDRLVDLFID